MSEIKDVFDYTIEHHGMSTVVQKGIFSVSKYRQKVTSIIFYGRSKKGRDFEKKKYFSRPNFKKVFFKKSFFCSKKYSLKVSWQYTFV